MADARHLPGDVLTGTHCLAFAITPVSSMRFLSLSIRIRICAKSRTIGFGANIHDMAGSGRGCFKGDSRKLALAYLDDVSSRPQFEAFVSHGMAVDAHAVPVNQAVGL